MISIINHLKWFKVYRVVILLLIVFAFFFRISLLKIRFFDPDEFQHLHGARLIYHGQLPYRDYFDHHTPFLHFIMSGLYPIFGEEIGILFVARALMMVFTAVILCLIYILTKILYKSDAGLFAVLFLSYVLMFQEKTIEIRPDLPAVAFWLASLIFMVKGIKKNSNSFAPLWFLYSGLSVGIAIMFTQKTMFALAGQFIALVWLFFDPRLEFSKIRRLKLIGIFIGGVSIPIILTCIYFLVRGGLWQFIDYNFIMNSQWKHKFKPYDYIKRMITQNPFFPVMSLLGLFIATFWIHRRDEVNKGSFVPVFSTYALIGGLFIMPVPYRQYYQLFLPLLAMYFGMILGKFIEIDLPSLLSRLNKRQIRLYKVFIVVFISELVIVGLIFSLNTAKPVLFNVKFLYPLLWACLGAIAISALIFNKRQYAALIISILIIIHPLDQTIKQLSQINTSQLDNVKHIMEITAPEDSVLDGWTGFGFLRPHAYFYYFLHPEMRAMLSEKELSDDIIQNLEEKQTKVIIYDSQIKALPGKEIGRAHV